jgi:hypothetical protein
VPEATQAFAKAEEILATEMNQEGLANLEYERGYAANDAGDFKSAQPHLQRALDDAIQMGSVQLRIRALTQLSSGIARFDAKKAADYAQQAIDLARKNRLDTWAANGLVRLAAAQLRLKDYQDAEKSVREGLQLAHDSQQPRAEALANATLASLMNQENRPEDIVAPAQAALAYYQKNGYFIPAGVASILLIRAERDKGHYDRALSSANAFLDLASRSGVPELTRQAEEVIGTVLFRIERYPEALTHFLKAKDLADAPSSQQTEALFSAMVLRRMGRFVEFEEMLRFEPASDAMAASVQAERVGALLSRIRYGDALVLARQTLQKYPAMDSGTLEELTMDRAIAESHLQQTKEALKEMDTLSASRPSSDPLDEAEREMALAEVNLQAGLALQAQAAAAKAAGQFKAAGALDSELRSACIGASATVIVHDSAAFSGFSQEAVDIGEKIQQTWSPQVAQSYLSRPDIRLLMREVRSTRVSDRR